MPQNELVEGLGLDEYQYGFIDDEAHVYRTKPGLSEEVVRQISKHKEEPEWMLEFRPEGAQDLRVEADADLGRGPLGSRGDAR